MKLFALHRQGGREAYWATDSIVSVYFVYIIKSSECALKNDADKKPAKKE